MPKQRKEAEGSVAAEEQPRKKVEFLPYQGPDSLPAYKELTKGRPEKGIPPKIQYGDPRFSVARSGANVYKVIAFYASPRGVQRRVWATLKPSNKRPKDQSTLERLKAAGIQGAF